MRFRKWKIEGNWLIWFLLGNKDLQIAHKKLLPNLIYYYNNSLSNMPSECWKKYRKIIWKIYGKQINFYYEIEANGRKKAKSKKIKKTKKRNGTGQCVKFVQI